MDPKPPQHVGGSLGWARLCCPFAGVRWSLSDACGQLVGWLRLADFESFVRSSWEDWCLSVWQSYFLADQKCSGRGHKRIKKTQNPRGFLFLFFANVPLASSGQWLAQTQYLRSGEIDFTFWWEYLQDNTAKLWVKETEKFVAIFPFCSPPPLDCNRKQRVNIKASRIL